MGLCRCPGSPARTRAWCRMTVNIHASCNKVKTEILARVAGDDRWYDPHNKGTYTLVSDTNDYIEIKRLTGNRKYTDIMDFEFTNPEPTSCIVLACSESQVPSVIDFNTDYCNLRICIV